MLSSLLMCNMQNTWRSQFSYSVVAHRKNVFWNFVKCTKWTLLSLQRWRVNDDWIDIQTHIYTHPREYKVRTHEHIGPDKCGTSKGISTVQYGTVGLVRTNECQALGRAVAGVQQCRNLHNYPAMHGSKESFAVIITTTCIRTYMHSSFRWHLMHFWVWSSGECKYLLISERYTLTIT